VSCVAFLKWLLPWRPWPLRLCFYPNVKILKIISVCYQNFGKYEPNCGTIASIFQQLIMNYELIHEFNYKFCFKNVLFIWVLCWFMCGKDVDNMKFCEIVSMQLVSSSGMEVVKGWLCGVIIRSKQVVEVGLGVVVIS
jgi:hypothetical protein